MYDASAENRYETFFYAQYDPATRAPRYVNAGIIRRWFCAGIS
jgi:hypothetical protein